MAVTSPESYMSGWKYLWKALPPALIQSLSASLPLVCRRQSRMPRSEPLAASITTAPAPSPKSTVRSRLAVLRWYCSSGMGPGARPSTTSQLCSSQGCRQLCTSAPTSSRRRAWPERTTASPSCSE